MEGSSFQRQQAIYSTFRWLMLVIHWVLAGVIVFDMGFSRSSDAKMISAIVYFGVTVLLFALNLLRQRWVSKDDSKAIVQIGAWLLGAMLVVNIVGAWNPGGAWDFAGARALSIPGMLFYLFLQLVPAIRDLYKAFYNPALLFVGSFAVVTIFGGIMLKLPKATVGGISWVDAFFTAGSAVSVTGLASVDTGTVYTRFGHWVIMLLIQFGGLGVLTFTSFFAYFFKGGSSFREGLYVKDFLSSDNLSNVLRLAVKIVLFTLGIELLGAVCILLFAQEPLSAMGWGSRLFFAAFHSVSAFCNAGFSTLSMGMYDEGYRSLYGFQLTIAILFIFGGLGFNIMFNFYAYFKTLFIRIKRKVLYEETFIWPVRAITLNSRIVLVTTLILIVVGTVFMFFVEYNNVLKEHDSFGGKLITAFFCAVTPRTAGFNSVDMTLLSTPTILLTLLLMWIGASPASTGGGIKTSTFAIATLNIFSVASGRYFIELGKREIDDTSVKRAFAIICISLIVIGFAVFFISWLEPDKDLMGIAFECFSAYSTVGLSLGITPQLTDTSKIILIVVMFVGRIGTLNLLIGIIRQVNSRYHRYPTENILIN
jgi:potassium uptake TrkH family protein